MKSYNVTRILKPDATIDLDAYHSYSPLFLSYVLFAFKQAACLTNGTVPRSQSHMGRGFYLSYFCISTIAERAQGCPLHQSQVGSIS